MDKPRVILVNRVYWPSTAATAQLLTDLAEGLAANGWPVQVIAAGESSPRHNGVTIHRTGSQDRYGGLVSRTRNYISFLRAAKRQLLALARPGDVVLIMTDPPMLGAALTAAARLRGARVIHWIQDVYPEIVSAHVGTLASMILSPLRRWRDRAWCAANGRVALGEDMAAQVGQPDLSGRVTIVPNWAPRELHATPPPETVIARRRAWGITDQFVVSYSGNLGRVHEFATIIAAAERLKTDPRIVFLFIGTGARFEEIRSLARQRDLNNVRLLPPEPRAHLAAALSAADAQLVTLKPAFAQLVYPSKLAGVLAAARPVLFVGPTGGEIAQLLAREECGLAVAPGEGGQLAAAIAEWRADPAHCARLGQHSREAYERHFTFAGALAQWEQLLRPPAG